MLQVGSRGSQVLKLQRELKAAGLNPGPIDGDFGPKTLEAVRSYQQAHQLEVDGIAGPRTLQALNADAFSVSTPHPSGPAPLAHPSTGAVVKLPPADASHAAKVETMLAQARSQLGFREGPHNSNPFSHYFGRPGEAWCADFVSYCATKAGFTLNTASAQGVANTLKAHGTWKGRSDPQPGDVVTFRWDGSHGWADHVAMVENVFTQNGRQYITTLEGNSSDGVKRRTYPASSSVINGYGRLT
jgi:hypothetical protein